MGLNTKYKDSLFSFLFSNPDVLRELYCALEGVTLPPDVPVTINTLRDVIFMDKINDISFEIGGKLVILIEHQSTINPNMALRLLMYIARVYEKIIKDKNIYSTRPISIPRPEFFVLYNGVAAYPDEQILKLSDAFESADSLGIPEKAEWALELVVKVININHGKNEGIARRCKMLAGYSAFIGKVRDYENEGHGKEEAMRMAVKYCREHNILKEILEANASEVMNMLITEWNWDDAKKVWHEEGREEGREESREEIARNALAKGVPVELIHDITGLDIETIERL
jgi:predicted transposase YdaD